MNDEPDLELWLRASAYLDGELDAVERARAEADPAVMAEVEQLRVLQEAMRAVDPATASARESAIGAAMREFDVAYVRRAPGATLGASRLRSFRPRQAWPGLLGAVAAAVVVVAALGFVVSNGLGGSDDDAGGDAASPAMTDDATARTLDQAEAATATTAAALNADMGGQAPAEAALDDTFAAMTAEDAPAAPNETEAPAATTAAAVLSSTDFVFASDEPIVGEHELALAGAQLLEQQRTGQLANTPETRCGTDDESRPLEVLAEGLYTEGTGVIVPVLIAIDPASGETLALDAESCAPVAIVPTP